MKKQSDKKQTNLESAYAEMARDQKREKEAAEWTEITFWNATSQKEVRKTQDAAD